MVIGDPINQSKSPLIHNAGYRALGFDGEYVYLAAHVRASDLKEFVGGVRAMHIRGVSVTIPHKQTIGQYLDEIDETARQIGAINTVVNNNGVLRGYNSDWQGVVGPIEKHTVIKGKKAVVLGAGGAARAAIYGLVTRGAMVTIMNRTHAKAEALAREFGVDIAELSEKEILKSADIIVQTTSVGMSPHEDESLVPMNCLGAHQIVLDAVYKPLETKLLCDAKQMGATTINGLEMLLGQAYYQFELYTGHAAPTDAMRQALA